MNIAKRRGQISSHVFVYILGLIIVAGILVLGYKAITNANKKGEQVALIEFSTVLSDDILALSSDEGSSKVAKYEMPAGFDEICFVDLKNVQAADILDRPFMQESVKAGAEKNVFLFGKNDFKSFFARDLGLLHYPYYSCVQSKSGAIQLRIDGKNTAAAIKTPPSPKYCQNAKTGVLCDGLEVVFGVGYKADCCKEFSLCC